MLPKDARCSSTVMLKWGFAVNFDLYASTASVPAVPPVPLPNIVRAFLYFNAG